MPVLNEAITTPKFKESVQKVARITQRRGQEAGFAVYQVGESSHRVSPVIHAGQKAQAEERKYMGSLDAMMSEYSALNPQQLLYRYVPRVGPVARKDIALLIHSHPSDEFENASKYLRPSLTDLETHEELLGDNPELVEGILVVEPKLAVASILLYKQVDTDRPKMYQGFDRVPKAETLIAAMNQSGIATTQVDFGLEAGEWVTDPAAALDQLSR